MRGSLEKVKYRAVNSSLFWEAVLRKKEIMYLFVDRITEVRRWPTSAEMLINED